MKQFKTITELEILKSAYVEIVDRWASAETKANANVNNPIAMNKEKILWDQVQELKNEIIRLETKAEKVKK